jgi:hypothetical protein
MSTRVPWSGGGAAPTQCEQVVSLLVQPMCDRARTRAIDNGESYG